MQEDKISYASLVQNMKEDNLCTYYVLPLLGLNFENFGKDIFLNSYISEDCTKAYVKVESFKLVDQEVGNNAWVVTNPHFVRKYIMPSYGIYEYKIPVYLQKEVHKFKKGMYTQFEESTKATILLYSGLPWRIYNSQGIVGSDYRLLALNREEELIAMMEEEFGISENLNELPQELLPPPGPNCFMDIE